MVQTVLTNKDIYKLDRISYQPPMQTNNRSDQQLKTTNRTNKNNTKHCFLKEKRVLSFILLFHFFSLGEGGGSWFSYSYVKYFCCSCERRWLIILIYIFLLLKGGGLSFNLLCQVIHCLLTKLKCKRKTKKPQNTDFFSHYCILCEHQFLIYYVV